MNRHGYSLIELIIVIVILSIAIPMLVYMLGNLTVSSMNSEKRTQAVLLCQQKMEQIIADRWNPNIGFDNVIDARYPQEGQVAGFAEFSRSVQTVYVTRSGSGFVESATPTYYKKVTVRVFNEQSGEVKLETIIGIR